MGTINIYFIGICTHMREEVAALPGLRHRVVLVNARIPKQINGSWIRSHIPKLLVAPADIIREQAPVLEWDLRGARVDIENAVGDSVVYEDSFACCIPHLSELTPDLPAPSKEVVLGGNSEKASCYFDAVAGVFTAGYLGTGAGTAVLKVTTDGDPVVRVRKFREEVPQRYTLRDGAEIALSNVGAELTDDDEQDFLLHYETAEYIPPNAGVPTSLQPCCKPLGHSYIIPGGLSVGPGCSNSDFP